MKGRRRKSRAIPNKGFASHAIEKLVQIRMKAGKDQDSDTVCMINLICVYFTNVYK